MTLSNIFFGKKVVQQAYLNNALIYQSKGWETLPSTCMEEWTKDLGSIIPAAVKQCIIDSDDNIYLLTNSEIIKLNSDGVLIWSELANGIQRIAVDNNDNNNNVYVVYIKDSWPYIATLDSNGNIENEFLAAKYTCDIITNFELDKNCYYISTTAKNGNYFFIKTYRQSKIFDKTNLSLNNSTLVATDDSFLYAGSNHSLIKIDKNNISNHTIIETSNEVISNYDIKNVILDGLGNIIYIYSDESIYKYNFENKTTVKYRGTNNYNNYINYSLALDYQKNIYFLNIIGTANDTFPKINLAKYSSDGTLIFNTQILDSSSGNISIEGGKLTTDQYGNIYYLYEKVNSDSTYNLIIKKLINIEKKGN